MYNWSIANLERTNNDEKVVTVAHFVVEAVEGDDSLTASGSLNFEGSVTDDGFIPFDSLDESTVIGWVKSALGEEQVANIEATLLAKLALVKNPPTVTGLPWE